VPSGKNELARSSRDYMGQGLSLPPRMCI
jgi:hypothetical protein